MSIEGNSDNKLQLFYVLKNIEEQYSIWPDFKDIPIGWHAVGSPMPKDDCLSYINKVWVDMRPLSLRKQIDEVKS